MGEHHEQFRQKLPAEPSREELGSEETIEVAISDTEARKRLERIISAEHLKALVMAKSRFRYDIDPNPQPGILARTVTSGKVRPILLNPELFRFSDDTIGGVLLHEAGHHAPEVVSLQEKFMRDIGDPAVIPEIYRDDPQAAEAFFRGLSRHLHNALADMWLESFLSRRPYADVRKRIYHSNHETAPAEGRNLRQLPKPEQLVQLMVGEHRFGASRPLRELVDADVYAEYEKLVKSGALDEIEKRKPFENYFASEADLAAAIERKYEAYRYAILPAYLTLIESEVRERMRQQGAGGEEMEYILGGAGSGSAEAAPLTKEEREKLEKKIREIAEKLFRELEKFGEHFAPYERDENEEKERDKKIAQARKEAEERAKGEEAAGQRTEGSKKEKQSASERLRDLVEKLASESAEGRKRGLAEALHIPVEAVEMWDEVKRQYRREIESLASAISEIFLDNRRKRLEYLHREGEIIPGLEYETIAAMLSGETDPRTRMRYVRDPQFLESELEFIVDTSGSMAGEKIRASIAMFVITVEAFRKVREDLEAEKLLQSDAEQPLRIGVTTFKTTPHRVHELDEPITEERELEIIGYLSNATGGTSETETIAEVYRQLSLHRKNIFKLMVVLSDGYGDGKAVHPILEQLNEDQDVCLFAAGLGRDAKGVVETYLKPFEGETHANVGGVVAHDPTDAIDPFVEFLKRQIVRRYGELSKRRS
jgi:hypothetical protein